MRLLSLLIGLAIASCIMVLLLAAVAGRILPLLATVFVVIQITRAVIGR